MKKRILCTLIFSLLVLTVCSSETPKAKPDEITPTAIVRTQTEKTVRGTVAPTEKSNEPDEVETVIYTAKTEQKNEVEIVERVEKTTQAPTQKPTQKPIEKSIQDLVKEELNSSNNEQDIQNMISYIISHNQSKGMVYDSTLNTSNSGWLFAYQGCLNTTANRTYEEQLSRTVSDLDADIDSILALDGYATNYSQIRFNCYAEKQADGTYNIYFCYG
ncbi:MAG: hypothetical protein IJO20_03090 [Ruminococcus sp.]|nr:hypothetical protein [Ruminococcus sp.]